MKPNRIVLKVCKPEEVVGEVVRIDRKAQATLTRIMKETGLSAKYIVSQLITQGAEFIEVEEE